jgi:hypothetical protein
MRRDYSTVELTFVNESDTSRFEGSSHCLHPLRQNDVAAFEPRDGALANARRRRKIKPSPVESGARHAALNSSHFGKQAAKTACTLHPIMAGRLPKRRTTPPVSGEPWT